MKSERFILSFIAIIIGLLVAGGGFYIFQMTKSIPGPSNVTVKSTDVSPTPDLSAYYITVDSPTDESVTDKRTITISGKTLPDATITIASAGDIEVIKPTSTGSYTVTETIDSGTNVFQISAIFSNGYEKSVTRTVTYSTETF